MSNHTLRLLAVDDEDIDLIQLERSFKREGIAVDFHKANSGDECLNVLRGSGQDNLPARPRIVVLDINMPRKNGHEVLDEIRADPALHDEIVFLNSSSSATVDVKKGYQNNVAGYLVKPQSLSESAETVRMLSAYWRSVTLPPAS